MGSAEEQEAQLNRDVDWYIINLDFAGAMRAKWDRAVYYLGVGRL